MNNERTRNAAIILAGMLASDTQGRWEGVAAEAWKWLDQLEAAATPAPQPEERVEPNDQDWEDAWNSVPVSIPPKPKDYKAMASMAYRLAAQRGTK